LNDRTWVAFLTDPLIRHQTTLTINTWTMPGGCRSVPAADRGVAKPEDPHPMAASERLAAPISLFYSYSHKDEAPRKKLEIHLGLLKDQGVIRD
jgi:hypothetical protein